MIILLNVSYNNLLYNMFDPVSVLTIVKLIRQTMYLEKCL